MASADKIEWDIPHKHRAVIKSVYSGFSALGLTLVFDCDADASAGTDMPQSFALFLPAGIARQLLDGLRQEALRADRPDWLKSH